jgi:hypothetical protein
VIILNLPGKSYSDVIIRIARGDGGIAVGALNALPASYALARSNRRARQFRLSRCNHW